MNSSVIRKAVVCGVQEGHFGYVSGAKAGLGSDGKFQVAARKIRFNTAVAKDEIDLESDFLMVQQAVVQPMPGSATEPVIVVPGEDLTQPEVGGVTPSPGVTLPAAMCPP